MTLAASDYKVVNPVKRIMRHKHEAEVQELINDGSVKLPERYNPTCIGTALLYATDPKIREIARQLVPQAASLYYEENKGDKTEYIAWLKSFNRWTDSVIQEDADFLFREKKSA